MHDIQLLSLRNPTTLIALTTKITLGRTQRVRVIRVIRVLGY